jgi:hypothetical protein
MELLGTPFVHEFERCPEACFFEDRASEIAAFCLNSVIERIKWFASEAEAEHWIAGEESGLWLPAKGYLQ